MAEVHDCEHLAAELIGKYKNKITIKAALTSNSSVMSCISNDLAMKKYSKDNSRLVKGDLLIVFSTSAGVRIF